MRFYMRLMKVTGKNMVLFLRMVLFSMIIGIIVGTIGLSFHMAVEMATEVRMKFPWLLYFLPLGGVIIVFLYRISGMEDRGTNFVLVAVRDNEHLKFKMAPLIYIGTVITHLFGGSSGREGAALQLGGSISTAMGHAVGLDKREGWLLTMVGMSAAFSALFGTPVTAVVFCMEVVWVGMMYYSAIVPCVVSAVVGAFIAKRYGGVAPTAFAVNGIPEMQPDNFARVLILALLCSVVSILFCLCMKFAVKRYKKYFPNPYKRVIVGGLIVIVFTTLVGSQDYNGAGMEVIHKAFESPIFPEAFALKIIFTAATLGAGFKGGEIVPTFFIGATFGNFVGGLLGFNPSFGAAVGVVALFCGVTNCPLASIFLSVEVFGAAGFEFFAVACAISYMLSGHFGLYSEQNILFSKISVDRPRGKVILSEDKEKLNI